MAKETFMPWHSLIFLSMILDLLPLLLFTLFACSRRVELERKLQADVLMSDERKQRQLMNHGKRESQYLRLRRTKIGLDDFKTVKVIGKGAFGEASSTIVPPVRF